jgi:hypothetical protein
MGSALRSNPRRHSTVSLALDYVLLPRRSRCGGRQRSRPPCASLPGLSYSRSKTVAISQGAGLGSIYRRARASPATLATQFPESLIGGGFTPARRGALRFGDGGLPVLARNRHADAVAACGTTPMQRHWRVCVYPIQTSVRKRGRRWSANC